MTEWRPIEASRHYEVSDGGQVRSLPRLAVAGVCGTRPIKGGLLKPALKANGYLDVKIDGKQRMVHVLVLEAFHGPRREGMFGCHNDGNRLNNAAANLRWGTAQDNADDKRRHGTLLFGEKGTGTKLTREQVLSIRADARPRNVVCRDYGVTPEAISSIVHRKSWAWLP